MDRILEYIKARIKESTTAQGGLLIIAGLAVLDGVALDSVTNILYVLGLIGAGVMGVVRKG